MTKTLHHRACHLCEAICGLTIETTEADGAGPQITSIKGDAQDSFSRGHICPKAVALQDIQNDPDRLRQPMRRVGSDWQAIEWDEAFKLVAERLAAIQEQHGNNAVAVYQGNPSVHNYGLMTHSNYFLGLLKTQNRFSATSVDQLPQHLSSYLMYGHGLLLPIPDIDNTDFMLILGGNPLASNGSIMTVPDVEKRLKAIQGRGGKVVVVDPRRSETAAMADQHVFVRPGGDVALLFGMLQTIFAEGLTRDSHLLVDGLAEVREAISRFSAEAMSPLCSVPAQQIRQLARDFAAADRAVCYGRMGVSTQSFGTLCHWLVQLLNLVTGNLDRVGGALCTEPAVDLVAATSGGHFNAWQSRVSGRPEYGGELPVSALAEEMLTEGDGQVRALITVAGNPVLSTPNGRQLEQALDGLEFMVSIDLYINETTRYADLILPSTSALENDHYDTTFNMFAVRNVSRFNQAILPKPEGALHDWEIFVGLARAFAARTGKELQPTVPPAQMIDRGLRAGRYGEASEFNLSVAALADHPHGIDLGPLKPNLAARLKTESRRVQAAPAPIMADLERFAALQAPAADELVMIGRRHVRSNNSWMHNYHRLVKGKPRHQLLMNPDDLAQRGLADGQRVRVSSRVGAIEVEVLASSEMMPGVVSLPHGWGHGRPGVQMSIAMAQPGSSANDLTDERQLDELSGNAALNGVPVKVEAA
ncbi:molybdopterin oxidoreductase family protein [Pseudomonas chlororaphis]|uniref:Formate dehydrogenase H n=1 Tax=Pseudomonas chlororaphis TaxID=587753 RepID=A0AAX3FTH7_9PSED|nr:molybdopterin oxidoreductase family protein [Pseudomonas chlororaphis]AZC39599.1 Formate dehydrogenase-O, major subunit [Pseudomonas chlororaphis subsp. piscium]AZC46150.1 Formate dehydrogenase-O, major subunit [Pseudomonas chlororaphis subsp. piscium]WDG71678.1 molybdopterin oxidoreductase family protein [Pseudomonas chlororaphis]WDH30538.1 molybdopterin oxidoreductase family protein [Pseudomonas chlororaphis]WDH70203.1 molybdopterin oxidoreductase family protein [Pseudomonas chlororaphis]